MALGQRGLNSTRLNKYDLDDLATFAQQAVSEMGIPWETSHPQVKEKVQEMHTKTKMSNKHFCAIPRKPEDITAWKQQSVQLFVLGDDRSIIRRAHQNHLNAFKEI